MLSIGKTLAFVNSKSPAGGARWSVAAPQKGAENRVAKGAEECCGPRVDLEALEDASAHVEHGGVDDEHEEAEGEDGDRQGEQEKQGADEKVERAQDNDGAERGPDAMDMDAGDDVSGESKNGGVDDPSNHDVLLMRLDYKLIWISASLLDSKHGFFWLGGSGLSLLGQIDAFNRG